jgi:hypothetical protein
MSKIFQVLADSFVSTDKAVCKAVFAEMVNLLLTSLIC